MALALLRMAIAAGLLAVGLMTGVPVRAQTSSLPIPAVRSLIDENGIDRLTNHLAYSETDLTIGDPQNGGLAHTRYYSSDQGKFGFFHNYMLTMDVNGGVAIGGVSYQFDKSYYTDPSRPNLSTAKFIAKAHDGRTLAAIYDPSNTGSTPNRYLFTDRDGTKIIFDEDILTPGTAYSYYRYAHAVATSVTKPSGEIITLTYKASSYNLYNCPGGNTSCGTYVTYYAVRLQSVSNNFGYMIHYSHGSNAISYGNMAAADEWMRVTKVAVVNLAQNYCDPAADSCAADNGSISYSIDPPPANTWDPVLYSYQYATFTDGRVRRYTMQGGILLRAVKGPTSASDDFSLVFNGALPIVSEYHGKSPLYSTSYRFIYSSNYPGAAYPIGSVSTDQASHALRQVGYIYPIFDVNTSGQAEYDSVICGNSCSIQNDGVSYLYDQYDRVSQITFDGVKYLIYNYDDRGNVTETDVKIGGVTLSETAAFDATCANAVTCNKPNSTADSQGNITTYAYDTVHGGVTSVTSPAASSGAAQPQTRTSYAQFSAYYKNASGTIIPARSGIYLPSSISVCIAASSCAGTAGEVKTTFAYGSLGVANNLLPTATTIAAGDGAVSSTTSVAYDAVGNKVAEDGPLAGSADTTIWAYNADRQATQIVGPDPDGTGPLHNRAVKTAYNGNGQVISVSSGYSNSSGSGFVELSRTDNHYDQYMRKTSATVTAGGAVQARTDFSFGQMDRIDCVATRMNPAVFVTATTDACALGTQGAYGPDRITRNTYDDLGRVLKVQSAYGLPYQRDEITKTYTSFGSVATMADAKGNLTSYHYDQYRRLTKTSYPSPTAAGVSSTTDYEQLSYDAAGRVTNRRLRDGKQIAYTYDNLGRQTLAHMVNPADANDRDIATSYDLLGRITQVDDGGGRKVTFTYDALGRKLTESPQLTGGATVMQYDAAGRRTRLTWPDGFYVSYDYDILGEMLAVRENGASSGPGVLARFAYDEQGKPVGLTRGNGVNDGYSYDAASRLAGLTITHPTAGNAYSYAYNPAGQLVSRSMTNDAYAWTQAVAVNRSYTTNGLNQYTASGAVVPTYDGRGNTTSAGATAYAFDSKNKLTTFGTNSLGYDAMGRLASEATPATRFVYDGTDLIAETDGSNTILRRYVHIPGTDNVLVWYEGSGTNDKRWLTHDERGSTTLVTNASGASLAIDAYDEYGIPQSTNLGRFQYTGQTWLPELGMYYYKARIYSASLGRFMQTDPTGYDDGPNWYNYTHGDPIGGTDPSGMFDFNSVPPEYRAQAMAEMERDMTHSFGGGGWSLEQDLINQTQQAADTGSTIWSAQIMAEQNAAIELTNLISGINAAASNIPNSQLEGSPYSGRADTSRGLLTYAIQAYHTSDGLRGAVIQISLTGNISGVNWTQTYSVTSPLGSASGIPDCAGGGCPFYPYVTTNGNTSSFYDSPGRNQLGVTWTANTNLVITSGQSIIGHIANFSWGYQISTGGSVTAIPVRIK